MANPDINKKTAYAWAKFYEMKEKHDDLLAKNVELEEKLKSNSNTMDEETFKKHFEIAHKSIEAQYRKKWDDYQASQNGNDKMYKDKIRKLEGALKAMSEVEKDDTATVRKLKNALKSMTSV